MRCGLALLVLLGCATTQQQQQPASHTERSMRELELAASLRREGSLPGALHHLRTALELDPRNVRAHLLLAYIHMERREWQPAEREVRLSLDILAQQKNRETLQAEARNLHGLILIQQNRFREAVAVLRKSANDPFNTAPFFAWGNLGWAHYKLNETTAAISALKRATATQPRFCVGYYRLGKVYLADGKLEAAEQALTRAIEADERCRLYYQQAWALRGEARARLGRRQDAVADFERCVQISAQSDIGGSCKTFLQDSGPKESGPGESGLEERRR